jgi:hypothetical protein
MNDSARHFTINPEPLNRMLAAEVSLASTIKRSGAILAETREAIALADKLIERTGPLIWEAGGNGQ